LSYRVEGSPRHSKKDISSHPKVCRREVELVVDFAARYSVLVKAAGDLFAELHVRLLHFGFVDYCMQIFLVYFDGFIGAAEMVVIGGC
jgi:hypothetical protein